MRLTVLGRRTLDVEVGAGESLADVHSRIAELTGVAKRELRLTRLGGVGGGSLEQRRTTKRLWWRGQEAVGSVLEDGSTLEAHVRFRGGSRPPPYRAYWVKHSVENRMNATQMAAAFAEMKLQPRGRCSSCPWKLQRVVDNAIQERLATALTNSLVVGSPEDDDSASFVDPIRHRVGERQFETIFDVAGMPFIPKGQIFEEGFERIRSFLRNYVRSGRTTRRGDDAQQQQQNPAEAYYQGDDEVLATAAPNGCRRAVGVFHPLNVCFSALLFPPDPTYPGALLWLFWPHAVLLFGYPANYYLARPCFLYLSARARTLTLRESSLVFRNAGHPGYVWCSGYLGVFLPLMCLFSALAHAGRAPSCCIVENDQGLVSSLVMNGSPHAFSRTCRDPQRPETTLVPLEIIRDAIVIDRRCCCGNPYQAELAGLSTLAIVGPNDSILGVMDAVPRAEAIAFVDAFKAAQRHVPRPMDDATAAAFARYQQSSWLGLYDAIHSAALPEAHVELVTTTQPRPQEGPTTTTLPLQDQPLYASAIWDSPPPPPERRN
mmetsp:Transcript_33696/g.107670  ORF Transcript_33696/g.107670 Transcript_33696/m.107670 type:complete len:546 (+) Transcript_33696:2303-3940(+)